MIYLGGPMKRLNDNSTLAWSALLLSVAATAAWAASHWFEQLSLPVAGLLAGSCLLAVMVTALIERRAARRQHTAWLYLSVLCQLDSQELIASQDSVQLPTLPKNHPWFDLLNRMRERQASYSELLEHAEHARAAVEIRARRDSSRFECAEGILKSLPEPIVALDRFDRIMFINRSAVALFDLADQSAEKRIFADLVRREKLSELVAETRHRGRAAHRMAEIELADPDGEPRWYHATANPITETMGQTSQGENDGQVVIVLRDISSQKEAQKRNAEFVSSVSHEMKTPLTSIKAYVELLADLDPTDEETREEFLEVIDTQADRLQRLVGNMLNLARVEAGVVKVDKQPYSLNELLEEAFQVVQPSAEQKNVTLVADLSPLYLGVHVDRDMMLQAAINLLSNAVKYTPENGKAVLRSRQADGEVLFEIEDNGVGLNPEDCERVFEKFYRVKKDSQMAAGTGLGLPLVKHITEEIHNGRLAVSSTPGAGSTFSVYLPSAGNRHARDSGQRAVVQNG